MFNKIKKTLKVVERRTIGDFATVTCRIPKFRDLRHFVQIGEYTETEADVHLRFDGLDTMWKLFFYPNGQYDYGKPTNDCRLYVMLKSCEEDKLNAEIKTYMISQNNDVYPSNASQSLLITTDRRRNWTGPFVMHYFSDNDEPNETLLIKCTFRLIRDEDNECKRGVSDSSPTNISLLSSRKKSRYMSPTTDEDISLTDVHENGAVDVPIDCQPKPSTSRAKSTVRFDVEPKPSTSTSQSHMEDDVSFESPPDPFTTKSKSPMLYARLTQHQSSSQNPAEKWVANQRGDFVFRKPSTPRTMIFTPDERNEARLRMSRGNLSPNRADTVRRKQNAQQKPFTSSGCLSVSDIASVEEADPNMDAQSDAEEKSEKSSSYDPDTLPGDDESNDQMTLRQKIQFFDNRFK